MGREEAVQEVLERKATVEKLEAEIVRRGELNTIDIRRSAEQTAICQRLMLRFSISDEEINAQPGHPIGRFRRGALRLVHSRP